MIRAFNFQRITLAILTLLQLTKVMLFTFQLNPIEVSTKVWSTTSVVRSVLCYYRAAISLSSYRFRNGCCCLARRAGVYCIVVIVLIVFQ